MRGPLGVGRLMHPFVGGQELGQLATRDAEFGSRQGEISLSTGQRIERTTDDEMEFLGVGPQPELSTIAIRSEPRVLAMSTLAERQEQPQRAQGFLPVPLPFTMILADGDGSRGQVNQPHG